MIVVPAVDLRGGACVQLEGGDYQRERVRLDDPVGVARRWAEMGFAHLHVVDLDAATGRGSNEDVVRDILERRRAGSDVQVGGGVRSHEAVDQLIAQGASRVIVGTRAIEEPEWLERVAEHYPERLLVAADVRGRKVVTRGWTHSLPIDVIDLAEELNALPLAGLLVTAVHVEGRLQGTDLPLFEDIAESSRFPLYASGGVTTMADLRALEDRLVSAVVVGMALYSGVLDPRVVADEYGE
ncbi:MAG TPA: 1-(5-phosphoribosyl)-5-[(5-phosphoribosylamino)methylideneamino] imidazole-4-carboxamide isomerase [Gemmatimonadaceae bacterium]|nr:1-(5-phosphoribosyl)-5-[(5-phosphoribosylamino)methylideneamino] imidazole-4-carboxamide isomerase [Gemmatimonadaceae bacterium]